MTEVDKLTGGGKIILKKEMRDFFKVNNVINKWYLFQNFGNESYVDDGTHGDVDTSYFPTTNYSGNRNNYYNYPDANDSSALKTYLQNNLEGTWNVYLNYTNHYHNNYANNTDFTKAVNWFYSGSNVNKDGYIEWTIPSYIKKVEIKCGILNRGNTKQGTLEFIENEVIVDTQTLSPGPTFILEYELENANSIYKIKMTEIVYSIFELYYILVYM